MLTITTTSYCFCLFPNISFSLSLCLSLHRTSQNYSKRKMTKNFILFPHPRLAGASFPGCLLPFCVPVTASSYLDLHQRHLPFPHLSHPALGPSLALPFCLSLLGSCKFHNEGMFSSSRLKPILDLICPSNCSFLSLSSVNSLKVLFLVPGLPLLILIPSLPQTLPYNSSPWSTLWLLRH